MMNYNRLLVCCGCALLATVLIVCKALFIGDDMGDKPTLPSNGTTVTTPDGTTNSTDGTTPSGNTDLSGTAASDPTTPSSGVTEPTNPTAPLPPDVGPTDPSTGEEIIPTNPGTEPPNPDLSGEYDFGNITPGNVTIDDWNAWDTRKKQAFLDWTDNVWDTLTAQERHNSMVVIWYGGYNCHTENHACRDEISHNHLLTDMERGCPYCGKNDCPSFFALDENLFTKIDFTKCPEYGVEKDPTQYCQECGLPNMKRGQDPTKCCTRAIEEFPCAYCGLTVYPGSCHTCKQEDIDAKK